MQGSFQEITMLRPLDCKISKKTNVKNLTGTSVSLGFETSRLDCSNNALTTAEFKSGLPSSPCSPEKLKKIQLSMRQACLQENI